ncbi:nucleotide exchange factor GrpE [Actinopolymorpha alba]|uniref:nucleotide exchange factor GrpE n=1 Tax=Actinopolymorpha alba TaxID=533267 RepID=UPI00035C8609|nr:nucleotide exchange factor GrpE [Actinopolymorpha alba]
MTQAEEHEGPVIRDRRRIDPLTGKVREGARESAPQAEPPTGDATASVDTGTQTAETETEQALAELKVALVERTNDLKRLQAEYVNYKRRVDRDREVARDLAVAGALTELLPVVDDVGRAREHGELEGGFKAVAEALESILAKLGLVRYGEVGEPFDPRIHEALMHAYSDDVSGPTCAAILQPGYRYGERVLRAARVAVTEPTVGLPPQQPTATEGAEAPASDEAGPDERASSGDG